MGGEKNPRQISHFLPTISIQSFQASARVFAAVAMAFAHFINEEIFQGGQKQRREQTRAIT